MIARLQPIVPFTLDSAGIADNLCKVEVFYEQFDYESIEESEAYPVIRRITLTVSSPVSIQTQALAVFVYATQAIAFEWKPGFTA